MYERKIEEGSEKPKTSRTPIFPEEWKNQFGLPVEEHRKQLQINLFEGYAVFGLDDSKEKVESTQEIKQIISEEYRYE